MAQKCWVGALLLALTGLAAPARGQTYTPSSPVQTGGMPLNPSYPLSPPVAGPVLPGTPAPNVMRVQMAPPSATPPGPDLTPLPAAVPPPSPAQAKPFLMAPVPTPEGPAAGPLLPVGGPLAPPVLPPAAEVSQAGGGPTIPSADLFRLEASNVELRRQMEDLRNKYESIHQDIEKRRAEEEAEKKRERQAEKRRPAGPFPSTERKLEPMYRVGLFWWRDDSKEIAGRGAYHPDMEPAEHKIAENVYFGDGLVWQSEDKFFKLIFHNLTQLDLREPVQQGDPLHGGFVIPRQRWYFNGSVGDYVDFVTAINRGYSTLDVLDSYADFIVNREWLKFRVGRTKMPSQYEYVEVAEGDLLGPERSLFVANYAANRQLGALAQGFLFDRRIRYYVGVGGGQRRSFEDFNGTQDFFSYVDYRPFITWDNPFLKNLHLVGAYNFGDERQPLSPFALRTMNQESGSEQAAFTSPTILEFNTNAFENGPRAFWSFEPVWFYKNIGFLGGVQGGYQSYSLGNLNGLSGFQNAKTEFLGVNSPIRTHVPIYGWSAGAWWFVTGEEITRRRFLVEPKRPFGFYDGTINPGAIELFGRVANLQLGSVIFSSGLVDQTKWTNRATATDFGFNWYLNHFIKFTFDWQHTFLGDPVILNASTGQKTSHYDMFLFRTQLYF